MISDSKSTFSNIFCFPTLEDVEWRKFALADGEQQRNFELELTQNTSSTQELLQALARKDFILATFIRLLSKGIAATWVHVDGGKSNKKELFVFEFGNSKIKHEEAIFSGLKEISRGKWKCSKATDSPTEITRLFLNSLHNKIEWKIHELNQFTRLGDRFILNDPYNVNSKGLYSFSLAFFMNGPRLCFHAIIQINRLQKISDLPKQEDRMILFAGPCAIPVQYVGSVAPDRSEYLLNSWSAFHNFPKKQGITVKMDGKTFIFPKDLVFRYLPVVLPASSYVKFIWRRSVGLENEDTSAYSMLINWSFNDMDSLSWKWLNDPLTPAPIQQNPPSQIVDNSPMLEQPNTSTENSPILKTPIQTSPATQPDDSSSFLGKRKLESVQEIHPTKKSKDASFESSRDDSMSIGSNSNWQSEKMEDDLGNMELDETDLASWIQITENPKKKEVESRLHNSGNQVVVNINSSTSNSNVSTVERPQITSVVNETTQISQVPPIERNVNSTVDSNQVAMELPSPQTTPPTVVDKEWAASSPSVENYKPGKYVIPPSYKPIGEVLRKSSSNFNYSYIPEKIANNQEFLSYAPYRNSPATPRTLAFSEGNVQTHKPDSITGNNSNQISPSMDVPDSDSDDDDSSSDSEDILDNWISQNIQEMIAKIEDQNGSLLSLVLKETKQQHIEEKLQRHQMPTAWDPRYELLDQLCTTSFGVSSYIDINDGLFANLSVKHYLKDTLKNIQSRNPLNNPEMLAEEPSCDVLETALDPFRSQGNVNSDMMWIMLMSLEEVLKGIFGSDSIRGPLNMHDWLNLSFGPNEPLLSLSNIETLSIPNVIVGFQEDWVKMPANALNFWEKSRCAPYSPKKNLSYIVICPTSPSNETLLYNALSFFTELSTIYELCNLGQHRPFTLFTPSETSTPPILSYSIQFDESKASEMLDLFMNHFENQCKEVAKKLIESSVLYLDASNIVIYVVNPFPQPSMTRKLFEKICSIITNISSHYNIHLALEIIPLHHIISRQHVLAVLKEIAFSVFNKSRRILSQIIDSKDKPIAFRRKLFEPLFILASSTNSENEEIRQPVLHICYMLSDCKEYLVSTFTDDRGELLETWTFPYLDQNRFPLFQKLWELAKQILHKTQQYNWKIVIGKYGVLSLEEMKEWQQLTSEETRTQFLLSQSPFNEVYIISLTFNRSLQLFSKATPNQGEDSYGDESFACFTNVCINGEKNSVKPLAMSFIVSPIGIKNPSGYLNGSKLAISLIGAFSTTSQTPVPEKAIRWLTHQLNSLSWLTLSPLTNGRQSALPFHFAVTKKLSRVASFVLQSPKIQS